MPWSPAIFEKKTSSSLKGPFSLWKASFWYKSWKKWLFHYSADKDNWVQSLEYYRTNNTHINNAMFTPNNAQGTGV